MSSELECTTWRRKKRTREGRRSARSSFPLFSSPSVPSLLLSFQKLTKTAVPHSVLAQRQVASNAVQVPGLVPPRQSRAQVSRFSRKEAASRRKSVVEGGAVGRGEGAIGEVEERKGRKREVGAMWLRMRLRAWSASSRGREDNVGRTKGKLGGER